VPRAGRAGAGGWGLGIRHSGSGIRGSGSAGNVGRGRRG
jgi:hypothetical protein